MCLQEWGKKRIFSYLVMHQMNSLNESRTVSSKRRRMTQKMSGLFSLFVSVFSQGGGDPRRGGHTETDSTMDPGFSDLEFWHLWGVLRQWETDLRLGAKSPTRAASGLLIVAFMWDQVYYWEMSCEQYSKLDKHSRNLGKRFSSAVTSWKLTGIPHWLARPKQDDMQADLFFPRSS